MVSIMCVEPTRGLPPRVFFGWASFVDETIQSRWRATRLGSFGRTPSHRSYLRFAAAVISTDNFAMKLAPHQLEPGSGNGLIGVVAIPLAV
jgi:hypothetical protein